jgi:hypothetical protein
MSLPFFALPEEERAEWRGLPVTMEFIKYVHLAEAHCADAIVAAVRKGQAKEAEILSGKLEAIQTIKDALAKRITPVGTDVEETFTDPAALWSGK